MSDIIHEKYFLVDFSFINQSIEFSQISLDKFAARVTNNDHAAAQEELCDIRTFLRLDRKDKQINFNQVKHSEEMDQISLKSFRVSVIYGQMPIQHLIQRHEQD